MWWFILNIAFSVLFSPWTVLFVLLGLLFYKWGTSTYYYFAERGIIFAPPTPFLGNLGNVILKRESFSDVMKKLYNMFPKNKCFGVFELRKPVIMIRDPELIKQIALKDFDHFVDHATVIDEILDDLFARSLFFLKGQKWRDMRATLSPAFTGSKMRQMFPLIVDCSDDLAKYLLKESAIHDPVVVDTKDLFTRFTNDVIATTAFGVKVDSFVDPNNEFYEMGKIFTNVDGVLGLKFIANIAFPSLMKLLHVDMFPESMRKFFRTLVMGTMAVREKEVIIRPDMINLLMQARKGKLINENNKPDQEGFATVEEYSVRMPNHQRVWEDDDLTAQCLLFHIAGFETSSNLMCFAAHELAVNPYVQKRLLDEVDAVKESLNGKPITYDILQKMQYMDMVISETLRKWPPIIATDRTCNKSYVFQADNQILSIRPGQSIWIPIAGIHHDPDYFPDPTKFDPERFNDENRNSIKPFTYLPFGAGPRNCIGSRFALMECKVALYGLLSSFTFETTEKTQEPLKLAKSMFTVKAEQGFWIRLKPRLW